MRRIIFAIYDTKADEIVGTNLPMFAHEAAAIRMFVDVLNDPQGYISKHPGDFNLLRLGYVDELGTLTPALHVVQTGEAWLAAQPGAEQPATLRLEDNRS